MDQTMHALNQIVRYCLLGLAAFLFAAPVSAQPPSEAMKRLEVAPRISVQHSPRWERSPVTYTNAIELYAYAPSAAPKEAGAVPTLLARLLVTTEERRSHAEAVRRLREIAEERTEPVRFIVIGGWPALERTYREPLAVRGKQDAPIEIPVTERATTVIAADKRVVRFEAALMAADADPAILREAQEIARSAVFPNRGKPKEVSQTLRRLERAWQARKPAQPQSSTAPQRTGTAPGEPSREAGEKATGAPLLVQNGVGELEVVVSNDGTRVVVASNAAMSFSADSGATFNAGNTGVFGLNDPSLARGASGSFYLAVIAFPDGTAAQGGVNGCANAVSSSGDGGANFAFVAHSTVCPFNGAGICFPDQEHVGADAANAAAAGGDQLYVAWRNFTPAGAPANCRAINSGAPTTSIVCSQDNGATWTARAAIAGAGDFPRVAVGSDGSVYVVSIINGAPASVMLNKFSSCANGLAVQAGFPVVVAQISTVTCPVPGLDRCNSGNTLSSPTVAVDPNNANHVFVAFAQRDPTNTGEEIAVTESRDGGSTWPRTAVISNATVTRRFMPWACSLNGNAFVSWYDRRAANAAGANNDLTDFFFGRALSRTVPGPSLTAGSEINLSNNPDPQCASGWACGVRNSNDSEGCTVQPQAAGFCVQPGGGGSLNRCDFSAIGACPGVEVCVTSGGCPKYGDYNGIACTANHVYTAWASATPPNGVVGAPAGINVFTSVIDVTPFSLGICLRIPEVCKPPKKIDRGIIVLRCELEGCIIRDPIPRNCLVKWSCPGCGPEGLCPPWYYMVFDGAIDPWEVAVFDAKGNPVPHEVLRGKRRLVVSFRPDKEGFREGQIGDYQLAFRLARGVKPGKDYTLRTRLIRSGKPFDRARLSAIVGGRR